MTRAKYLFQLHVGKMTQPHCFFLRNEISIKWVYLQLGTKFTKFINRTYEEKKNTNKTRKVIFHYKLLCLLSPEAHKTKICCFISLLFGWRDEGTPALRNKKSMYISRQFLNSFDISVCTNLAWRNKFYLILSVFCYFF